ncbi:hypothetical protein CFI11_11675 [Thalassococcus sp. S3]|nr:hypothetical protein CFI11_11675 [Thalassococcus sp. S3]
MIYLITCAFTLFCPAHTECSENQRQTPSVVKVRVEEGVSVAEFWTPGSPASSPWPAIVSERSIGAKTWTFFTSGDLHGSWMLTVTRPKQTENAQAQAVGTLSFHNNNLLTDMNIMAAEDVCTIKKESV